VSDDQVIGSAAEAKAAAKDVPSLALALFPRPELLVAGVSWLASDDKCDRADGEEPNAVDPCEDPTGEK
jgi:hypothetical protein